MKLITVLSCVLLFCAISVQSEKLEASPGEINKFEDAPENDEEVDNNWFELQHETIEQQADQPTSGEQFIAIRIGAAGTKDEVNPNLAGLVRIATEFLPKTYTFVKIVSASREVVAGIKYELLVNALNDNKAEVQCDIRVLEQPWIITSENEKLRSLIYTNCSNGEPISNEPLGDNVQHRINPIFNNEEKVMTAQRLKDMESLIIPSDGKTPRPPQENLSDRPKTIQSQVSQPREEDDDTLTVVTLSQGTSSFLDDFFSFGKTENKPIQSSSIENEVIPKLQTPTRVEAIADRGESENTFYHVAPNVNGETQTPIVSNTETSTQSATVQVNPIEEKQANVEVPQIKCTVIQSTDDVVPGTDTLSESITSNVDTMTARQKRESMYGYDPMIMERVLLNKLLTDALARLDRYDDDDNKRVPVRVLHRHVVNDLFTLDVTVADTKCSEMASRTDNCRMKIIDDSIKLCRLEIEHLENDDIKLKKSECAPYTNKKRPLDDTRHKRDDQIVGGVSVIPNSEVEPILSEVLSEGDYQSYRIKRNDEIMIKPKIVKGGIRPLPESENSNIETLLSDMLVGGDYQSYRLVRVIEASRQVVAGSLYRIKGEFEVGGIQKICNVKLWVKVARQGKEITEFICDESGNRSKRQILGGISPMSDTHTTINLLNEVLSSGDYQSYSLVRIIESTIQTVSGRLYKIKAEFSIDQTSKICNIKIWDRPWLGKSGREVEFNCDKKSRRKRQIRGGFKSIKVVEKEIDSDFLKYIENILEDVIRRCEYQSYKLIRVIDSTSEVLDGFMFRIKAEFSVNDLLKICNINIWEKENGQGVEVQKFLCQDRTKTNDVRSLITADEDLNIKYIVGEDSIKEDGKHSESKKSQHSTTVATTVGFIPIPEEDKSKVEKLLQEVFAYDDYKSYTLVKILQSWQQVVAGINYKVRAEVKVRGKSKICDIKILNMFTRKGKRVVQSVCQNILEVIPSKNITSNDATVYIESIVNGVLRQENYQSYRLVRIIKVTKEKLEGIVYHITAEFTVDGTQKLCNLKIWDKVSNQHREVQEFICEESNTSDLGGTTTSGVISQEGPVRILGGISSTTHADKPLIEKILTGVLASDDYQSYRLVRIIESTKQVVAGILYRIKAEFAVDGDLKICNVTIWEKVSNEGREVQEFMCERSGTSVVEGPTSSVIVTSQHSIPTSVVKESTTGSVINTLQPSAIRGGIRPTTNDDKPTIENILNEVLTSGDYQSYRLIRIIESTKQTVAGILYRIKAEFVVDGAQKICNVRIWDKVSNQGREVQEFICEEPRTVVVEGETTGYVISHEHSVPSFGGISPTTDADKPTIENILNGVLASGDYKSYRLVRIIESTKQIVAGILYRIKAEFAVDGAQKICNVQILEKVSNEGREVQEFMCEEPNIAVVGGATTGGVITREHSVPILGGISPTTDADKPTIENILNGVLASGDYKSYRLVRIIESTKQIVAGILYRIKAEFAVDGAQKICNVQILEKVSNEGREVQEFMCEEPTIAVVGGATTGGVITHEHSVPILGGISPTTDADKPTIENILNEVLASGDYKSYRLVRIIESTKQIVAGILYRIKAEFAVDSAQKICNVRIWDKVSNQGREVQEFMCEEPTIAVVGGATTGGVITHEHLVPILGGITPTTDADKPTIENILNGVLASGDYKSYRLIRIIESTKQIVAGILYRIKAEFAVDGAQKICNVQILEKVSNEGREVQKFMCEEPTIAVVGGATTGGVITHEHSVPILRGITPTTDADKPTIENILNEVLASGDYKSYRLVRIIESTKQIVAGILYRIKAEFAVDGAQKICNVQILEKVSNEGREVQEFMCEEPTIAVVGGATTGGVITHEHSVPILGGITPTTDADKPTIENILNEVLASGDYKSYRLVRIIESTKQIVAGILYRIKAEFAFDGAQKICNVQILEKVSNEGREVQEFMCEEPTIAVVGGATTGGVITHKHSVPILGGISPTTDADKPTIENILNEVLASGDYKSYRLVRIIESTKQIVAGILYRIKAEFAVDGAQKICNVRIWDKVSNQSREVQEFMCEEPTIAVVGGAIPGGVITHEQSVPILGGISPTTDADKPTIENILNGVLASGDYKSYRLVRIIESTKQIVAGILYRIKAEFAVDGAQKICNVQILEKVSNEGRAVQEFMCDEPNIAVVGGASTGGVITHEQSVPILGGITPTTDADKPTIENILNGVLASGDYKSYRLVRIIESTKQIVAGILYRIKAEFAVDGAQKICNVQILDKVSNEGREVQEFMCDEPNITVVGGATTGGVITHDHSVPIPGGISPTTDADKPTIENILNGVLASGDYKSYRLVRIIESTKQIVAGILYRIKAEFAIDGAQKICNVQILEKVSNEGREVQEFMCDEPNIAVVGGASTGGVITHEHSVPILGGITPTTDADKPAIENILNGVLASGDYKSYRLVRIIESTKQIVAGILYRIKAEFAVDGAQKICNVQILEKVSNEGREVQEFMCDEPNIAVGGGATTGGVITHEHSVPILGGITPTTDADKPTIENILNGVLASGDYKSYRLVRIIESTKQIVAGILYRIKAEFAVDGAQKICNVGIWEKVSNQGREVQEFMCDEPNIPVVGGATTGGVITHEHSVPIPGGISPTTDADKPAIENILNGVLASGDYKSYRLVRIIESTKQIVAGILYRIKAEFAVNGAQKICNVQILEKVSNEGREVQEFLCEEPTIAVVGGATTGGVISHEHSVPILGGIRPTTDADKPAIENILNGVLASGDYKSYRLVRIIESTKQVVAGILYRIKAEFAVDGAQKICNVQILEKVSNEGREVQEFMCEEPNIPVVGGATTGGVITHEHSVPILGGISPTTDADKPTIENILNGVLASGDYKSYRLVRIIESTKQIVAGILYRIKAEFAVDGAQKICNLRIWDKVSNQGREVQEFMCDEPTIAVVGGAIPGGVITHEQSVPILGGISPTTDADKPTIENILNGVLASGDYKSYRLVRIIESTKQIVAGILYRIKAEFAVDGAQKICNVQILEKVSNEGREVQEFMCDEPNIAVVGGASTGGVITHEQSVPILGGITPTTDADKPTIENILNGVLASGDYKSYRLVRIIESTKQIVAGILYRIKAEFAVDGAQKICNVQILEKVSNEGREVQEFMCDEPSITVVGGATTGGVITHEHSVPIPGGISPTTDADKPTIENILNGVLASGDYKSYRLVRIIESTKQIVAGILYRIKAEFAVDGAQKICNVQILEKVSNEGREVQEFMCDEPNIAVVGGASTGGVITHEHSVPILGGITPTTDADKPTIENILNGVLASGDYKSYRLVRIIESTKQIVAGILYRIKAEFAVDGAQKICNLRIWDKVSNQGREVQEFMCDEPTIAVVGGAIPGGVITHEQSVPILGGISPTTDADKPNIENILNGVLASGDYKSYRLVRIIESTKQIVAGILYRIKAEFAVDGAQKICNVQILEKVLNEGREVQEFMCDEPNIAVVGGASTGGVITHEQSVPILGGITPTTDADKPTIENILNGVLASGDYKSYRLVRIIESTKQIVAGILYRIKAEFAVDGAQKICNVQILEKVSNEGREVQEFMCDEPNITVVGGATTGGVITHEHSVPIPGGISPTTDADKPTIENILNGVLASGDYKSYRLVRIIESTKQIVAGILYRIKAEFAVDGAQKICNVQILEKVSNEGRQVQEFMCDEPNIAVVGGASTGGVITHEHSVPILGGITPTTDADKPTIENILNGVLASGDYKSYRLVRIIESTKQIVAGILYRIKAELAVDGAQKICNLRIWDKVSNQGREVQEFMCDEPTIAVVGGAIPGGVITHEQSVPILGGISPTTDADKPTIENILNGVLASGDYKSYRLVRIIESTKQIVAGILYRIKAEFAVDGAQKICNVQILEKVSNEGREVQEFMCDEPNIAVVGGASTGGVITHEQSVPILGGITPTTDADKPTIENILNGVLASGDYKSYRLVRIIESTKQIVAGIMYRIKAEFAVDGAQKICNVQILEKVSNEGREVQEFMCDEPNIAVGGGATTGGVITHEHSVPILGGISPTTDADKPTIENILNGVLASGDYKSYRLVRIIESTKQIVAGILYRIKAEFAVDGAQKICTVRIWEKVSNQGREVQEFMCDEPNIAVVGGATTGGVITHEHSVPIPGGISPTTDADKPAIENILNGVLASGDYKSYRLVRIIESTKQVVAGILYRITAEFAVDGAQKICNVQILEKVSNEGREVQEFMCEEPNIPVVGGATTGGVITHEHSVPILGGISPTTDADKPTIENILNGVLASGDYKSYRLVRIIESTKQIVAGILYRIKAVFAVDGAQKICNLRIWEKVSNQGREVQEFMCDEPNIAVVGGATTGGVITHEHSVPIPGGISPTTDADKPVIENILNGVLASGDYKSYRLVRIIESTKQIVAGILYRIKAEFAVNGAQKICNVQILEKVSNEGREVQEFLCEEPTIAVVGGATTGGVISHEHSVPILGGIRPTTDADKPAIENILNGVLASGDYKSYRLVRIIESTKQVVAGILYRIKAEFAVDGAQKICNVQILEKVSNQGREVQEFMCEEPNIPVVGGATTGGVITHEHSVPILGGISPTTDADKPTIENILNGVLASGDYKSYRLVRIIESTKQIVSGILYRIKAEFEVDGAQKICNVRIWDKVSNEGREVQEFMCEERNTVIEESNTSAIESVLNGVLSSGEYHSYKLVKIIKFTTKIEAGVLYDIRGEFLVNGVGHICDVKIWDGDSHQGGKSYSFNCTQIIPNTGGFNPVPVQDVSKEANVNNANHNIPGGISATSDADKTIIESLLNEVLSEGDYRSYRLLRIIESSEQVVAGLLYRIKAEFDVDGENKICNIQIWAKVSNQGNEVTQFNCFIQQPVLGGVHSMSYAEENEVITLLNNILDTGDYQSYRLLNIIEIKRQIVAGVLYKIKAEFDLDGAEKICDITILQKLMNQGNEVTKFSCVRKRAISRRSSSSSSGSDSDSSESSEKSNKNKIRNVLYDVLDDDEYRSYRLVRIIQGSRQKLTTGTLYFIEAIFLIDGDEKQCNVNINQRSRTNRKVYFNCDTQIPLTLSIRGGFSVVPTSEFPYIQNLVTEVLSDRRFQSYRVVRIIEAKNQVVSGMKYRVKGIFAVEEVEQTCVIYIYVDISDVKEVTEFNCEQPQVQQTSTFLWRKTRQADDEIFVLGGTTPVDESEKPYVQSLLNEVLISGAYQSYSLVRIIESKRQTVAGILYTIKAEFMVDGASKTCTLTIWEKPWLGKSSRVVEFKECDGESLTRAKRNAPGSSRPVDQEEYPKIEQILTSALATGDQQNYRLARVLHATKQLSSGWTYKIRAVFDVDGTTRRCNIKLWNRPWLSNASTIESFKCDEHDEHTIRINHDAKIKRTLDFYLHNNFTDNKIFEMYEKLYNKNYQTTLSRNMRLRIFKTNLRKIRLLNQNEQGTATYGVTEFADLTPTEYRMRTGLVPRTSHSNHIGNPIAEIPNVRLPREFDWRTRGAVSEVKNQGSCGSCWAFSVIGNIEGIHAIKTGVLEEYSEQELVDCDTIDNGCNGGLPDDAYKAIEQIGGLETEKDYPYTARRGHCSFNATKVKTQIKGAVDLPKNETAIAQWLLQNGPVSIGINANAMQFYRGGVSHPWRVLCNKSNLDHGVLIVGFGVHDYPKFNKTLPYWIIKNSWGPRWGEQGYYRVYRGDNTCGVSEMVSSAVLE